MTESASTTYNTAEHGSPVGIQAEQVHNSSVYQVLPGDPPSRKYEVGVRFLENGVPTRARELIDEAIARGYDGGEVRFHWVLALLSKRSCRDLGVEQREQLGRLSNTLHEYADNEWKRALEAICELLDRLNDSEGEAGLALKKLEGLPSRQRDGIVRHLDLVLTAGMKEHLWGETRRTAEDGQLIGGRRERVWAYFQRDPIKPRARSPVENSTTTGDWWWAVASSGLFTAVVGYLGWSILGSAAPLPMLAYLLMLAAGYVAARTGVEWRYRTARLRAKEREHTEARWNDRAPEEGFASQVTRSFTRYFSRYVPQGASREVWLNRTTGIRALLREEVVDLYRERRVGIDRVNWLIRHLVSDVRTRWEKDALSQYREQYRTGLSTKLWCSLSLVVLIIAAGGVVVTVIRTEPLPATVFVLLALPSGRIATVRWLHIVSERRRCAEDWQEYERLLQQRYAAYQRWKDKLDSTRPREREMENWLSCDKTLILDKALRHYRLAWHDIITHTFLLAPADDCKTARVKDGPRRRSKYDVRLFLVTRDGVREFNTELDFERVTFDSRERTNFRFDAVSSVHVVTYGGSNQTLELTLTNGPTRKIRLTAPEEQHTEHNESSDLFPEVTLEASGFAQTLHVLEGIAAEGKRWFDREPRIGGNSDGPDTATGEDI